MEEVTRFDSLIQANLNGYVGFLQQFLRIPTERMREHEAVRFAGAAFQEAGCEIGVFEGMGIGEPTPAGQPLNVIARRPGIGQGPSLLLGAHLDTVPPCDPARWTYPPWSGHIENHRIYARGAHDDRTGVAILCMVADLLRQADVRTKGDLAFIVTTEEEFSLGGMRSYLTRRDRIQPDAYVMVDGNRAGYCIVAHAGALSFRISVRGPSGSAQVHATVHEANPIDLMAQIVRDLQDFESRVRTKLESLMVDPRWPPAIIAVTDIQSRGWFSNVPEECTASGYCNVVPPLTIDEYKRDFDSFLQEASGKHGWLRSNPPSTAWGPLTVPAMVNSDNSPLFQALAEAHRCGFGTDLVGRYIGGWGDPRLLDCPDTIFYGPGGGGGDHSCNEYYELGDLAPMLKTLSVLVVNWCGAALS